MITIGEGDGPTGQALRGHRRQQVDIAFDQRRLGDLPDRMIALMQHLQHLARDAALALARLVGVGVHANGDVLRLVRGAGQLAPQQGYRVHLREQAVLEVQPRRQAEVAVRRPGNAIDACDFLCSRSDQELTFVGAFWHLFEPSSCAATAPAWRARQPARRRGRAPLPSLFPFGRDFAYEGNDWNIAPSFGPG
jgi:hypothetical protein